jgi:hypothetical protein
MEQRNVVALDGELAVNAACIGIEFKLPLADSIISTNLYRRKKL